MMLDDMHGIKKVKILADKLDKFPSKKKKKAIFLNFYWDRDMWQENQSKTKAYKK